MMFLKVICGGVCELWVGDLHFVPTLTEYVPKHTGRFLIPSSASLVAIMIEQANSKFSFLTASGLTFAPNRTLHSTQNQTGKRCLIFRVKQ